MLENVTEDFHLRHEFWSILYTKESVNISASTLIFTPQLRRDKIVNFIELSKKMSVEKMTKHWPLWPSSPHFYCTSICSLQSLLSGEKNNPWPCTLGFRRGRGPILPSLVLVTSNATKLFCVKLCLCVILTLKHLQALGFRAVCVQLNRKNKSSHLLEQIPVWGQQIQH